METEPVRPVPAPGVDPLIQGLLCRLAGVGGGDFLPDVPDAELLSVFSAYHRRSCRAGLIQATAVAA
ncbi:hypothetical protein [Streptomyces sp. NPDC001843]|uniref:hypothetical protein n=1 Tax=Streptomyces sp. NPDC001843 TaxID=3364617 RepID=UPI0036930CC6